MSTTEPEESAAAAEADDRTVDIGSEFDDRTLRVPVADGGGVIAAEATGTGSDHDASLEFRLAAAAATLDSSAEIDRATGEGLDPARRVAPAPGSVPGDSIPSAEPGVRPWLPVVYGARPEDALSGPSGQHSAGLSAAEPPVRSADAIAQEALSARAEERGRLPSLARRERRRASATLLGYGVVCVVSLCGLVAVGVLAFR